MARIEVNLADVHEPQPVPAGQKYKLTIAEAIHREDKSDIEVSIGIDDHLDAPNIRHYVNLPKPEDDERKVMYKKLFLSRFLYWFNIPHDGDAFDTDDFAGATAELDLSLSEPNENGDVYNRLMLPKVPMEGTEVAAAEPEAEPEAPAEEAPPPARPARPAPAARTAARAPAPVTRGGRAAPAPASRPAGRRR